MDNVFSQSEHDRLYEKYKYSMQVIVHDGNIFIELYGAMEQVSDQRSAAEIRLFLMRDIENIMAMGD